MYVCVWVWERETERVHVCCVCVCARYTHNKLIEIQTRTYSWLTRCRTQIAHPIDELIEIKCLSGRKQKWISCIRFQWEKWEKLGPCDACTFHATHVPGKQSCKKCSVYTVQEPGRISGMICEVSMIGDSVCRRSMAQRHRRPPLCRTLWPRFPHSRHRMCRTQLHCAIVWILLIGALINQPIGTLASEYSTPDMLFRRGSSLDKLDGVDHSSASISSKYSSTHAFVRTRLACNMSMYARLTQFTSSTLLADL